MIGCFWKPFNGRYFTPSIGRIKEGRGVKEVIQRTRTRGTSVEVLTCYC